MTDESTRAIRRALISVSDKTGIEELARGLAGQGVELLSTGGTCAALQAAGIPVTEISGYTGFPEMMDGRVKTLHPKVHGGILGRRGVDDAVMEEHGIEPIDAVIVNLYPFAETVARPDCTFAEAIENIDIGGPAMVRSAAKNHRGVLVVVDPADYDRVVEALATGGTDYAFRKSMAVKAFRHTARYDAMVAGYLGADEMLPESLTLTWKRIQNMRYGENPHQAAAFYAQEGDLGGTLAGARQLQGKALSYNNVADADAALTCVQAFEEPACVIVKHANPCGVAVAGSLADAYDRAFATDPTSAFGGIIAFNRPLDGATLDAILQRQFVEVVIAPEVDADAIEVARKKKNVRLLACGAFGNRRRGLDCRRVGGGLLVQSADELCWSDAGPETVTERSPDAGELSDLAFAWKVAWFVKSNAIVYARDARTIGIGAGQMARVTSAVIAGMKAAEAGLEVPGSVMASDAFFPFRDSIDAAAEAGIRAIIQPGGSMRDREVIDAANEHGIAMVFTGVRHFRH